MTTNSWRKTHRYEGYDYASAGSYFVTICLYQRSPILSDVVEDARVVLSEPGEMIVEALNELSNKYQSVALDSYIVMPDHVHAILHLGTDPDQLENPSLGTAIGWFKTMSTNWYIRGVKTSGWPRYDKHFWQLNFYDRILRNESEVETRREYIANNPSRWLGRQRI